jgi:maltooligosyltrehalose trehalohydrolase
VVSLENHDQIANGAKGHRLASLVSVRQQKLAAAVLLTAPNVPMLFMGQEFGDPAPFHYFTSHTDPALGRAVSEGRRREFADFHEEGDLYHDPQAEETFLLSKVSWAARERAPHADILTLTRALIRLRRERPALRRCRRELTTARADEAGRWLLVDRRSEEGDRVALLANFADQPTRVPLPDRTRRWEVLLVTEGEARLEIGAPDLVVPAHGGVLIAPVG